MLPNEVATRDALLVPVAGKRQWPHTRVGVKILLRSKLDAGKRDWFRAPVYFDFIVVDVDLMRDRPRIECRWSQSSSCVPGMMKKGRPSVLRLNIDRRWPARLGRDATMMWLPWCHLSRPATNIGCRQNLVRPTGRHCGRYAGAC